MGLLAALRFLTILPLPGGGAADERTLGRATGWYPLAGLVVGAILAGGWLLALRLWSASAAAAAGVILWAIVTRGFHLDGLADTFDGIGGGATRERRLAIMKDSRVGVFGVLAVALCLLGKYAFLAELGAARSACCSWPPYPCWGAGGCSWPCSASPPPRAAGWGGR